MLAHRHFISQFYIIRNFSTKVYIFFIITKKIAFFLLFISCFMPKDRICSTFYPLYNNVSLFLSKKLPYILPFSKYPYKYYFIGLIFNL